MNEQWTAHVKGSEGSFEVSVCYGKPSLSWGWFSRAKLRIEFSGPVEQATWHAERIAAALNAANYNPLEFRLPQRPEHG